MMLIINLCEKLCYFNLNIPLRELWKIDMYIIIITIIIHF